jgi:excisionase family DNA binding protein
LEILEEKLGNMLGTKEVAKYLGIDRRTVIKYHQKLGGVRLGRRYMFSEKEVINAIQTCKEVGGPGEDRRKKGSSKNISKGKRRESVGGGNRKAVKDENAGDDSKYGLLTFLGK